MREREKERGEERNEEFKVFGVFSASLPFVILRVMSDSRDGGYFSDRPNRTSARRRRPSVRQKSEEGIWAKTEQPCFFVSCPRHIIEVQCMPPLRLCLSSAVAAAAAVAVNHVFVTQRNVVVTLHLLHVARLQATATSSAGTSCASSTATATTFSTSRSSSWPWT